MKMYELWLAIQQSGNRKHVKVYVQAENQIDAKQLISRQYSGTDTKITGLPREVKQNIPKK